MKEKEVKFRFVKGRKLAYALSWLGYEYIHADGGYLFKRDYKFDRVFKDLHSLRADVNGVLYDSIKKHVK